MVEGGTRGVSCILHRRGGQDLVKRSLQDFFFLIIVSLHVGGQVRVALGKAGRERKGNIYLPMLIMVFYVLDRKVKRTCLDNKDSIRLLYVWYFNSKHSNRKHLDEDDSKPNQALAGELIALRFFQF